jgi:hypothetical protein
VIVVLTGLPARQVRRLMSAGLARAAAGHKRIELRDLAGAVQQQVH